MGKNDKIPCVEKRIYSGDEMVKSAQISLILKLSLVLSFSVMFLVVMQLVGGATAMADGASATRTLPAEVQPSERFEVSIDCKGIQIGGVSEILPEGFIYVEGSVSGDIVFEEVVDRKVAFGFMSEPGVFTYDVIASDDPGMYDFSGVVKGKSIIEDKEVEVSVTGSSNILVQMVTEHQLTVITFNTTLIGDDSVVLQGSLNDMGGAEIVAVSFDWGTTGSYGNTLSAGQMSATGQFSAELTGLAGGTTYHFRAKATGNGMTAFGQGVTFVTIQENLPATSEPTTTPIMYTLEAVANPPEGGSVDFSPPGGNYAVGTIVTLTANAAQDYEFDNWSGDLSGSENPETITMTAEKSVTVKFELKDVVTVSPTPTATPTITPTATPTTTLTATPTNKPAAKPKVTQPPATSEPDENGGGVNPWVIIGPIVGVLALGLLGYFLWIKKQEEGTKTD